jgi:uncharacterized protein with PIN domain
VQCPDDGSCFIADCHLGKVAKYLRFMGYDTHYFSHIDDDDLIALAAAKGCTILTRDRRLSERKGAAVFYLQPIDLTEQLATLAQRFGLTIGEDACRRCLLCNCRLERIDKEAIAGKIPERVRGHFDFFQRCPSCGRIYWHGDHYHRMKAFLETILSQT